MVTTLVPFELNVSLVANLIELIASSAMSLEEFWRDWNQPNSGGKANAVFRLLVSLNSEQMLLWRILKYMIGDDFEKNVRVYNLVAAIINTGFVSQGKTILPKIEMSDELDGIAEELEKGLQLRIFSSGDARKNAYKCGVLCMLVLAVFILLWFVVTKQH